VIRFLGGRLIFRDPGRVQAPRPLAADNSRSLMDQVAVLQGLHHDRKIPTARDVALEDRVTRLSDREYLDSLHTAQFSSAMPRDRERAS
jgi:hypothetical protein